MHNKGSAILSYRTICHLYLSLVRAAKSLIAPDLVRVWDSSYFAGKSVLGAFSMENNLVISIKIINAFIICPNNSAPRTAIRHIERKHMIIYCSTVCNCQARSQTPQLSWKEKQSNYNSLHMKECYETLKKRMRFSVCADLDGLPKTKY